MFWIPAPTLPILNEDSADVDLLGHVYAQPDFLLNGNMTTKNR